MITIIFLISTSYSSFCNYSEVNIVSWALRSKHCPLISKNFNLKEKNVIFLTIQSHRKWIKLDIHHYSSLIQSFGRNRKSNGLHDGIIYLEWMMSRFIGLVLLTVSSSFSSYQVINYYRFTKVLEVNCVCNGFRIWNINEF